MINLIEQPIMPNIDLDNEVVVYVPGYSIKGPGEPTLVNSSNFTTLFGDVPYIFDTDQDAAVSKNKVLAKSKEKSWMYAKGLVDSGLTLLFHRYKPLNAVYPKNEEDLTLRGKINGTETQLLNDPTKGPVIQICIRSKYFGTYYKGFKVKTIRKSNGVTEILVKNSDDLILEDRLISFDRESNNYLAVVEFSNIEFYGIKDNSEVSISDICDAAISIADSANTIYFSNNIEAELETDEVSDNFSVSDFEDAIDDGTLFKVLEDTENYPVSYITTGGYFIGTNSVNPAEMLKTASIIKAVAVTDIGDPINKENFNTYQENILSLNVEDPLQYSFGFQVVGCDTFNSQSSRVVLPDSYGYFVRLGNNIKSGIPAWAPVANNSQGLVAVGLAATRPIDHELEELMISNIGPSINPIITKKNVGYVIMGNRTLFPNNGVLGPQSFLNCRLVVNAVERSARRSANKLRIVSTNPDATFKNFKNDVEKTCDMLLTNGDGLAEYNITKLPKSKPATIDIQIALTVVEGIETFNIFIPYQLQLD